MTNIEKLRTFCLSAKNKQSPQSETCTAVDSAEFFQLFDNATAGAKWIGNAKIAGVGNIRKDGFSLKAGKSTFTIMPPEHRGGVQGTSVAAYHSLDLGEACIKVARAALIVQEKHGQCTDLLVSNETGLPDGRVSARRTDITKANGIKIDGEMYVVVDAGKMVNPTGKRVNAWKLQKVNQQASLF